MNNILPYENLAQELCSELKKIYPNDKVAVTSILSCVIDHEEDVKELLDFIKAGDEVDQETVSVYALDLNDKYDEDDE